MTAAHTPVEAGTDALADRSEPEVEPAATPTDRAPLRPTTYLALGAVALVALLAVFQYWVTGVEETRSQSELLRQLKADLASTAAGGIPAPAAVGHPIGLMEIPAIGLEKVVVEGSSARRLQQGPGHDPASARPGEAGDVLIVGRRSTYGSPFARLGRLHDGDTIAITTARGRFTYHVERGATRATAGSGKGTLTLATAAPGVFSDRVTSTVAVLDSRPLLLGTKLRDVDPVGLARVGGWFSDATAWIWVALWGSLLVASLFVAARAYRRSSARITYLLTTPIIIAFLFCTMDAIDRLAPVTR